MRTDKMCSTHDRPDGIGVACAVCQQRAAMVVVGKIHLLVDVGRRIPARPGIFPFMPLLRSCPKVVYPVCRQFPLDILSQGVRLRNVHKDMVPATVTTAQFTGWNDAVFAAQSIQSGCSRFIYRRIHAVDEALSRRNWDICSEFRRAHSETVALNQIQRSPFFQRPRRLQSSGNRFTYLMGSLIFLKSLSMLFIWFPHKTSEPYG